MKLTSLILRLTKNINEAGHHKTNKMACASSENSDQPGHVPNQISLCCPHEESWILSYLLSNDSDHTEGMPRLI